MQESVAVRVKEVAMARRVRVVGACVGILVGVVGQAMGDGWLFQERGYYDALIAEPRAANINVMFVGWSDEVPYAQRPGKRQVWDIGLGKEIPVCGWETASSRDEPLGDGDWGVGLWAPVSFHMMEDFLDVSNPILNTDYRFSVMGKAQAGIGEEAWMGLRIQVGHESTHLGDEFTHEAVRNRPDFERINVSYEYWELGLSFDKTLAEDHKVTLRLGGIGLLDNRKGFYSDSLLDESRELPRSRKNFEPIAGVEYELQRACPVIGWGPFLSVDLRDKTVYDYHKASAGQLEETQLSVNALVGLHRLETRYGEKGSPEFYVRYYYGVNPHGQFRSQKDYSLVGLGYRVDI